MISRQDKRIYMSNRIAIRDNGDFEKTQKFAMTHPIIFADVMRAFNSRPDIRFSDTLLVFCSCVKHGYIKMGEKDVHSSK